VSTQGTSGALFRRNVARMSNRKMVQALSLSSTVWTPLGKGASGNTARAAKWETKRQIVHVRLTQNHSFKSTFYCASSSIDLLYVALCLIRPRGFENLASVYWSGQHGVDVYGGT
jgi:hypothetical protein